ncbi:MAG: flippase-like domain-containing protein [Muribaculaceae bacterium]|nr:flippase-like domain-containing protein [Muribaculaceae bacterium]
MKKTLLRTIAPLLIGLGVCGWLFFKDFSPESWSALRFDGRAWLLLGVALLFAAGRDFGLAWRFHTLGAGDLSWKRAFRVDLMCAFTSAVTPSVVGGSALAIFYLNREGIGLGRATSLTLTTLFLDELFFVIFCPVIVAILPSSELFAAAEGAAGGSVGFLTGVKAVFWVVYAGICIWTAILYMAILGRPEGTARVLERASRLRLIRRWGEALRTTAGNMLSTSEWVKGRPAGWWGQIFGATVVSWFSRYFVVNALFAALVPAASGLLVFGRQFVVWVVLMVSPTPGGSGVSEWLFTNYYGDLIGSLSTALVIAMLWRILSYYIYLFAGACLLPGYFKKK